LTFGELRSFALGELGWSLRRYRRSMVAEFNLAAGGYWRNLERTTRWMTREILWELIQGNPYYKAEDKPKRKDALMKLSIDEKEKKEKVKPQKLTEQDLKYFNALRNGISKGLNSKDQG